MNWDTLVWFVLLLVFVLVEANTVALVSAWFAVGALAAMVVSILGGEIWLQVTVFITVSAVLLICLRRIARKYLAPKLSKTNIDSVIGAQCLVTSAIDNVHGVGQVKLNGMEWSARSSDGRTIEPGTLVRADRVEGVKLYVTVLEEKEKVGGK